MTRVRTRGLISAAYTVLVVAFVFLPILSASLFSFNADRFAGLPWGGFTLDWYRSAFADQAIRRGLRNSILVAIIAAPVATFLGFAAAYTTRTFRFPGQTVYALLLGLPPAMPLVVFGVAMLTFLSRIGLSGTLHGVIAAHVVLSMPFAMALIRIRLADLHVDIEAAAWNLGASRWAALRDVIVPFCMPAIIASLFITAAISFDEFMVAWFISGLNETLPVRLLLLLQSGQVSPVINAVGTVVFAVSIALVIAAQALLALSASRTTRRVS